jgi:putative two-component system response regulator
MSDMICDEQLGPARCVMVVDDQPRNLKVFERMLESDRYRVHLFTSGEAALRGLARFRPHLIVLDIKMPGMSGWEVNEKLKADRDLAEIPVLFLSGLSDREAKARAFAEGGVDYITKPFQAEEVTARIETHIRLHCLKQELADHNQWLQVKVMDQVAEISDSQRATITALAKLAESRDDDTGQHILRVQKYCQILTEHLVESGVDLYPISGSLPEDIFHASALHDIGKVAIPDAILLKPGKLTDDEFETMKRHTIHGAETLEKILTDYPKNRMLEIGVQIVRHHHERWDGAGYPDGLGGDEIPMAARIMAVGDVYDALRSRRPYKTPFAHDRCVEIVCEGRGSHFDPSAVDAFLSSERRFQRIGDELG